MKTFTLNEKLAFVEEVGRARAKAEAAICRMELRQAEIALQEARERAEMVFDHECWNGIASEFSNDEIKSCLAGLKHKSDFKAS